MRNVQTGPSSPGRLTPTSAHSCCGPARSFVVQAGWPLPPRACPLVPSRDPDCPSPTVAALVPTVRPASSPPPQASREWATLLETMRPLAAASTMMPPAALRYDLGALITAFGRYLPALLTSGPATMKLTGPFSKVGRVGERSLGAWERLLGA